MAQQAQYPIADLGGGMHDGVPASVIADKEFEIYQNFYPYRNVAVRRPGVPRLTITAFSEALTSIATLTDSTGTWTVVAGGLTSLARKSSQGMVLIPARDNLTFNSATDFWSLLQYKNIGYAVRKGVGFRRFTKDFHESAGIIKPPLPAILSEGAAGAVEAGTYIGVYTYGNSVTGNEGNPSPASVAVAIAANKMIDWDSFVTPTQPQVDIIRLYQTEPNQRGEYFWVADLSFLATGYSSNVVQDDLGDAVSFDRGLPPTDPQIGALWKERAWLSNGIDVRFSEEFMMEAFGEFNVIQIEKQDGHQVRALVPYGERLIVGKTNKVHQIIASGPGKFDRQTVSDKHGIFSHASAKVAEGYLFSYGGDDFYRTDGTRYDPIGGSRIRKILDDIPDAQKHLVSSVIYEPLTQYISRVPSSDGNGRVVVYNYRTDVWNTYAHPAEAPAAIAEIYDASYGQHLYAAFTDGHLYEYTTDKSSQTDFGSPIVAKLRTKAFGLEHEGFAKALRKVWVLATSVARDLTLRAYRDGGIQQKTRVVSLDQSRDWKLYSLNTSNGPLGATVQVELEYSGDKALTISELALDIAQFQRTMRAT